MKKTKREYQLNYAATKPKLYNQSSREKKAMRIIKILEDFFGSSDFKHLSLLDIGSSTGFMSNFLSKYFKKVIGIDIDKEAVEFAKKKFRQKNLKFMIGDAMKIGYKNNSFDVVLCDQVYEHAPDSEELFKEIYRVLKPGGVCYLSAVNKLWPWEVHYNLSFLSWLPKPLANSYVRLTGKASEYYETPQTYWGLKKITKNFERIEYTQKIFQNPNKYGYNDILKSGGVAAIFFRPISPLAKYLSPTFFWLLQKK